MDFKQSTIGEILDSEREMVLKGAELYGEFFVNAADFNHLLNEFLKSVNRDRFIFVAFLSQLRKHHTLALFSTVRLHHTQAMLDLRQVLEAGASAAYAIANPDVKDFADFDDRGIIRSSDALTKKGYKWLEKNYKVGSDAIKNKKKLINNSTAHSNIVYAQKTFKLDAQSEKFGTPFFDIEDDFHVKADLWMIGNATLVMMDLFYGVNTGRNVIKFTDDFIPRLKSLEEQNKKLRQEVMESSRFKKLQP